MLIRNYDKKTVDQFKKLIASGFVNLGITKYHVIHEQLLLLYVFEVQKDFDGIFTQMTQRQDALGKKYGHKE